jgi:hypothetical protein
MCTYIETMLPILCTSVDDSVAQTDGKSEGRALMILTTSENNINSVMTLLGQSCQPS